MPQNLAVLKLGYFFMLKSVLSHISLDRVNDREWQKIPYNFGSSHKLSARASEISPFYWGDLRVGI